MLILGKYIEKQHISKYIQPSIPNSINYVQKTFEKNLVFVDRALTSFLLLCTDSTG